jgi:NodT family efflux transporter outer membrane factor (OMF) lipoprotein
MLAGCAVGPKYARPSALAPPMYKEEPPPDFKEHEGWKLAAPADETLRGKWWEIFKDPQLNALEEQVNVSNQNLAQAEAQYRAARAAVHVARAGRYPTVTGGVLTTGSHQSANRGVGRGFTVGTQSDSQIPFNFSYEADIWGRVKSTIDASVANAQATAAELETMRLTLHAELAADYFQLHGLDAEKKLLDSTVEAYGKALQLTINRYNQGVVSQVDVVQARTQMETVQSQATDTQIARSQFEHAIAILTGKPPSELTISEAPLAVSPPVIPGLLPSALLERRPDIAASERLVAAANAQIGVAKAAFYPSVILSASAGLESSSFIEWFTWPSRFWSIGPTLVQTLFDGGRRKAVSEQVQAQYDGTVATYRQSVLTAFQEVEDSLSALRILERESREQAAAVKSAERSLELANNRYKGGITTYLEVITAQNLALGDESAAVQIQTRRMTASVQLVKALGGGWNAADLPPAADLLAKKP